jgi:hypothetical protein
VRVHPFAEKMIRERLARHGVTCGPLGMHYGAEGMGPALYLEDPEGNIVELKGPATGPEEDAMGLAGERCEACRPDAPRVTERGIAELSPQIPEWKIVEREGITRLERSFQGTPPGPSHEMGGGDRDLVVPQDQGTTPQRLHHGGQDCRALPVSLRPPRWGSDRQPSG